MGAENMVGRSLCRTCPAGGDAQRIGWFQFYFEGERWEWSPQAEAMHGYAPEPPIPQRNWCCRKHPDDMGRVAATLDDIRRNATAFSTRHRIIDTAGNIHHVVVVGCRPLRPLRHGDRQQRLLR